MMSIYKYVSWLDILLPGQVFWADLNVSFEGVVEAVNSDGTYNIRYDALVNGNISKELNVSRDRVTVTFHLEDSYFGDDVVEVSNQMASSRNVDSHNLASLLFTDLSVFL